MPIIKARTCRIRIVRHVSHLQEPHGDTRVLYVSACNDRHLTIKALDLVQTESNQAASPDLR